MKCLDCGGDVDYRVFKDTGLQMCAPCAEVFEVEYSEWRKVNG